MAQPGIAQPGGQALVAAMRNLAIEQQAQPVGMAERGRVTGGFQFGKGLRHAGKTELVELIEHRMGQQCRFSSTS
jgi:hypothetical protein